MRLVNVGEPSSTYYRGATPGPPINSMPVTATASGAFAQSGNANVSVGGHPGVWLLIALGGVIVWMHMARIGAD